MRGDITPTKQRSAATPTSREPSPVPARPALSTSDVPQQQVAPTIDLSTIDNGASGLDVPPPPKKKSIKKKIAAIVGALVVIIIIALVSVWAWYNQQLTAVSSNSTDKVKVTIVPGTDPTGIAQTLKKAGVIRSEIAFGWYVRLNGKAGLLQSGSYRLSKAEDVPKIVKHLTSGNTDTFSITFLPGATLAKHRQALISAGYTAEQVDTALSKTYDSPLFEGKPASADLEGYIYGETYNFPANATPEDILQRVFDEYASVVKEQNLVELYKQRGFTLYQGIVLASIIQREVATPEDAAQVAQVFELRLKMDMQLGSDVTYQYIADKTGQERSVDLDSPYNTRRYAGLPPGPISSPGLASLKAVGSPAAGDYVYFLSGDDDKTYFARTNEEHEQNIRDHCQKKCQII